MSPITMRALTTAGQTGEVPSQLRRRDRINPNARQRWNAILPDLSEDEVIDLTKGLTLAEKEFKWPGGSGAN